MTQAIVATVKQEALEKSAGNAIVATAKQEALFHAVTPTVTVETVKQEMVGVYLTQSIRVGVIKQEVLIGQEQLIPPPPVAPPRTPPNTYHPLNIPCTPAPRSRFRRFWATQPNVCPAEMGQPNCNDPNNVNTACEQPGLKLLVTLDPTWQQLQAAYDGGGGLPNDCAAPITGATIQTDNYVQGLIINILGTNAARSASICGNKPGNRLGYWLDSISGDSSGSSIRYVPTLGFTTNQAVQFVQMQAQADLQKLVTYGVANQVTVTAEYVGNGTIGLKIVVEGIDDTTTVVNSTMKKISNAWVWNS